jgi:hypothetical protein
LEAAAALPAGCDENEDDSEPEPEWESSEARGKMRGMHPVLVSRTGRSHSAGLAALAGGAAAGVTAASADVAAAEDSAFAFQVAERGGGTAALLHAAGTLRDAMLLRQTAGPSRSLATPHHKSTR